MDNAKVRPRTLAEGRALKHYGVGKVEIYTVEKKRWYLIKIEHDTAAKGEQKCKLLASSWDCCTVCIAEPCLSHTAVIDQNSPEWDAIQSSAYLDNIRIIVLSFQCIFIISF